MCVHTFTLIIRWNFFETIFTDAQITSIGINTILITGTVMIERTLIFVLKKKKDKSGHMLTVATSIIKMLTITNIARWVSFCVPFKAVT